MVTMNKKQLPLARTTQDSTTMKTYTKQSEM